LEGIILADVGSISLVLKGVEEEPKPAADDQFRVDLICEPYAGREVGVWGLEQTFAVLVSGAEGDAILGQQVDKAPATDAQASTAAARLSRIGNSIPGGQSPVVLARGREQQGGRSEVGRNKIGLAAIGLIDGAKFIPTDAEIDGQFGTDLPVVLQVNSAVFLFIVGLADVGDPHAVGAAGIAESIGIWISRDGGRSR
jgi:hypothetical protein